MTVAKGFSLETVIPPSNENIPHSRILFEGSDTGLELPGAVLESALNTGSGWLLFLTHDVPYEESLEICLLDSKFKLLDRASIAGLNATAAFENLQIIDDHRVRFHFLGKSPWTIDLLENTGLRLPFFTEPLGVIRPFGFSRRFAISHQK